MLKYFMIAAYPQIKLTAHDNNCFIVYILVISAYSTSLSRACIPWASLLSKFATPSISAASVIPYAEFAEVIQYAALAVVRISSWVEVSK